MMIARLSCYRFIVTAAAAGLALSTQAAQAQNAGPSTPAVSPPAIVTATVDVHNRKQDLLGFGAAICYYQTYVSDHPYRQEIEDAFFKGLNLQVLRLKNDYDQKVAPQVIPADAKIVADAQQELGHPIQILMCSWSPPGDLKTNGSASGGGILKRGPDGQFVYKAFADYWNDSLSAYAKVGVVPTWVSIQNEPNWRADYESCIFRGSETKQNGMDYAGYDKAFQDVYDRLQHSPNRVKLVGPETLGIGDGNPEKYFPPTNKASMHDAYGIAHHLYNGGSESQPDSFVQRMHDIRAAYPKKPKLMTEFDRGDWFDTAWLISDSLTEEDAGMYLYWTGIWPGPPAMIQVEDPKNQAGWQFNHGYQIGPAYYAIKHFSYFTEPGDRRVETSTSDPAVKLSAFARKDGKGLTMILLNTATDNPRTVHLDIERYGRQAAEIYQSTSKEKWVDVGALAMGDTLVLPPHSVTTVAMQ